MKILWLILQVIFHILLLDQLRFTAWPEMLAYPYLVSAGFSLYKDFILPYPPGLIVLLMPFFNLFGYTPEVLKIFTYVFIIAADILIFLILYRLTRNYLKTAIFLTLFIILQSFFDGHMLWFDFATILPLLISFFFSLKWLESKEDKNLLLVGMFLSLAVLVKQVALIYVFFFTIFFLLKAGKKLIINSFYLLIGGLIPIGLFFSYLLISYSFGEFWLWTLYYPLAEWSNFPGYVALKISKREIVIFIILFSPLLASLNFKNLIKNNALILSYLFLFSAVLAIYPRFSLFHFQPVIAFLIITWVILYLSIREHWKQLYLSWIMGVIFLVIYLLPKDFNQEIRFHEEREKIISKEISQRVGEQDRVFLLGIYSSQYVFTKTLPPTHWSDNFGWYLEIPGVQEWVLEGFKRDLPDYVFRRIPSSGNWFNLGVYQPKKIVDFINGRYYLEEVILGDIEVWKIKD